MVDKPKLDQMLANLAGFIAVLKGLAAVAKNEFLADADKIGNAKYHFVVGIECCIGIANHIIASENFRFPKDNAEGFTVLAERGIIAADLEEPLRGMARFRNRLVHLYWDIDNERVHAYLQDSVGDMERFRAAVMGHAWH